MAFTIISLTASKLFWRWCFVVKLRPQKNDFWAPDGDQTRNLLMSTVRCSNHWTTEIQMVAQKSFFSKVWAWRTSNNHPRIPPSSHIQNIGLNKNHYYLSLLPHSQLICWICNWACFMVKASHRSSEVWQMSNYHLFWFSWYTSRSSINKLRVFFTIWQSHLVPISFAEQYAN